MDMSPVHQVGPKPSSKAHWKGEEDKADRERERWEDNIREGTGLGFAKSLRAVENREKKEETGCEVICGAPTTLVTKE